MTERSKGHLAFTVRVGGEPIELFKREMDAGGVGVFTAPTANPVMPDGYRCGRFYCKESQEAEGIARWFPHSTR